MPRDIGRDQLRRLMERGAQVVEVLPSHEYEQDHLPGAINIPLKDLSARTASQLDRSRPVVLYCWDTT